MDSWRFLPFEDALQKVTYTKKIPRRQYLEDGAYPIISQESDFINGYWDIVEDVFSVDSPVVIFGDHTKIIKHIDFDFVLGADGVKILKPIETLNSKFFAYFLNAAPVADLGYARHYRLLKEITVPVPAMGEQKRIVAILDEVFADIEQARAKTEQNLTNARELFESYLQQVFSQRGEGRQETTIGQEIDLLTGFAFKSKDYVEHAESVPLIRGDNIIQGKLRWEGVKLWPKDDIAGYKKYELEEDDIVLAMDRTWVKAGMKYSKITSNDLPALLVQRVARLRCLKGLDADYLYHLVGSKLFENYILAIQTGLGVPHISGKQIQAFRFNKPNVKQQETIVIRLNKLAENILTLNDIYQKKLTSIDELKQSILQKAFSGELTQGASKEEVA